MKKCAQWLIKSILEIKKKEKKMQTMNRKVLNIDMFTPIDIII